MTAIANAAPQAVIWDIGNVLLRWDPDHLYRRLIPDDDARAAFYARLPLDEMNLHGDRDGDLEAKVSALAAAHPADAMLILPWWAAWDRMCIGLVEETIAIRDDLRARGIPCWAMSNFAADSWDRATAMYPELVSFDGLVISGRERVVKPDAGIYEIIETRTGLSGGDLFFIDDRDANIEAGRARGWRGHVYADTDAGPAALRAALNGAGF